ncbi:MAG TPA: hypothetical protein VK742_10045 [Candidatus Sulfotelmatobacter sp.]|jgi:ankyrin repeat protein|nr:hypothetical protein [Candidatus Sulfotelmatobacter sp.]
MNKIYEAIESGDLKAIRKLVEINPQVINHCDGDQYYSPLGFAIRDMDRKFDVIELLVMQGAEISWKTVDGYTPLHLNIDVNGPSGSGELPYKIASLLKDRGANIEAKNHYGWTPLLYAGLEGTPDEFAALLKLGARYDVYYPQESMPRFTRGQSLAQIALPRPEIIRLLLEYGFQPDKKLLECASKDIMESEDPNSSYVADIKKSIELLSSARVL